MAIKNVKNGLGRLAEADLRITKKLLPKVSNKIRKSSKLRERLWTTITALNQGNTPQCVAYAGIQWLFAAPIENKVSQWLEDPSKLYVLCQKDDGITHHKNPKNDGTSVGGLFQALKKEEFVKEYLWAGNSFIEDFHYKGTELVDSTISHVLSVGPVVVGSPWLYSMDEDLSNGFLDVDYSFGVRGGHAYLIRGVDLDKRCPDGSQGAFRIMNSWGEAWGLGGEAYLSFRDADVLFSIDSEVVTANELLKGTRVG